MQEKDKYFYEMYIFKYFYKIRHFLEVMLRVKAYKDLV